MSPKIGIILSHPVQYHAPFFRYLSKHFNLVVFYGHKPNSEEQGRTGFGKSFNWDIDLLGGYDSVFLTNRSKSKNFNQFNGISVPDIGKELIKNNITHVLIFGWQYKFYIQCLISCKIKGIPVGVRGDSQKGMQGSILVKMVKQVVYPIFLTLFNRVFYVGTRNKEYLKQYFVPENKLLFSPHAIDQDFWKLKHKNTTNEIVFIWIGKFIQKKRPLDALKAFEKLKKSCSLKVRLLMIGSGPLFESIIAKYKDLDDIEFLGFKNQTQIRSIAEKVSCLLLTSDARETWGLVVNEMFSCGIPAIVSDACGCSPDMITENSGIVYPLGNIEELANAMNKMIFSLKFNKDHFDDGINSVNNTHSFQSSIKSIQEFSGINEKFS